MPPRRGESVVGVDVGGTFTDIIIQDSRGLNVLKLPTSVEPAEAILEGLRQLGTLARRASLISHATTLATNALLTHTGLARTALITNEGFRDVLEIARQRRPELYDLETRRPVPLVERRDRLTVPSRMGADGAELEPLEEEASASVADEVLNGRYQSAAICFLNSYLNDVHERKMRKALRAKGFGGHISISSEVDREYREFERMSTTVVNAALSPLMSGYLSSLQAAFRRSKFRARVYVMNSDGGASTASHASTRPVTVIESGPAAGVIASKMLAKRLSIGMLLTFDMGGTTAKAGTVIKGEPDIINEFEAAGRTHSGRSIRGSGYPVRGQFIDLAEVSAGGGTIAWVDSAGELQAGPESAGSDPGPACYGGGGTEPTVTDANVVLGRLNPASLLGGAMRIHSDLARLSMRRLSTRLKLDETEVAIGILRLVNNSMARAISMVTVERGRDPRDFAMAAFGGAGPMHACDLAEEMGIREVIIPVHAGLFSAYGLLAGELTRTFTAPVMEAEPRLETRFRELEDEARRQMRSEGFARFRLSRFFEGRYLGQSHELLLPFTADQAARAAFDAKHKALYGYSLPDKLEAVNIHVRATVVRRSPRALRSHGTMAPSSYTTRRAWVGGAHSQTPVHTRESLRPGAQGHGPCIIEEYDSTLIVNPSWKWSMEEYGTRLVR